MSSPFEDVDRVVRACALVRKKGSESGTAYLVAPDRVVTCQHVVKNALTEEITVSFEVPDDCLRRVTEVVADAESDVAVLRLAEPIADRDPLQFSRSCPNGTEWITYGYPKQARWNGVLFSGVVDLVKGIKDGQPRMHLYSEKVAAGMGTPINGLSGSPVMVGLNVVGHVSEMLLGADDKPVFGLVYAIGAPRILELLGPTMPSAEQPQRPAALGIDLAERGGSGLVKAAVAQLQSAGLESPGNEAVNAAEALIALGEPNAALRMLATATPGIRARQLKALALAKSGNISESTRLLEALHKEGHLDAETGGLLGGRYKQAGLKHSDRAELLQAKEIYRSTYERTGDPYPGINLAALSLYLDRNRGRAEAATVAAQVAATVATLMRDYPEDVDHWRLATLAEAHLLQGRISDAKKFYEQAVASAPRRPHDIAVMRRQARMNLQHLGKDVHALDAALPVPGAAAFTGYMTDPPGRRPPRFPETRVPFVRSDIRSVLQARNIRFGVCSAARGGDLLFLEELLRRDGSAKVVLPFPAEAFKRICVGGAWNELFDRLLTSNDVEVVVLRNDVPPESERPAAFAACLREIETLHRGQAERLDQRPLLMTLWNGGAGDGADAFAVGWRGDGEREIEVIAPFR